MEIVFALELTLFSLCVLVCRVRQLRRRRRPLVCWWADCGWLGATRRYCCESCGHRNAHLGTVEIPLILFNCDHHPVHTSHPTLCCPHSPSSSCLPAFFVSTLSAKSTSVLIFNYQSKSISFSFAQCAIEQKFVTLLVFPHTQAYKHIHTQTHLVVVDLFHMFRRNSSVHMW